MSKYVNYKQQQKTKQRIQSLNSMSNAVSVIEFKNKETAKAFRDAFKNPKPKLDNSERIHWYIKPDGLVVIKKGQAIVDFMSMTDFCQLRAKEVNEGITLKEVYRNRF